MSPAAACEVFISRAFDATVSALSHGCLPIPPAPKYSVSVEMLATHMWTPGSLTGANKLTTKELQNGVPFCLEDHDLGPLIPDVTVMWPANANYAIMWPFSSRKMMFQSTIVKTEGKPTSCAQPPALIPFPMMTCGDPISAPTILIMTNFIANTKIGISAGDIVGGVIKIAAAVAIDFIFHKIGVELEQLRKAKAAMKAVMEGAEKAATETLGRKIAGEFVGKLAPTSWESLAKTGVTALTDFGISALEGNPTFKLKVGGGLVGEAAGGWESGKGWGAEAKPGGQDVGASTNTGPFTPPSDSGGSPGSGS